KMFARPLSELEALAEVATSRLASALGADYGVSIVDSTAQIGSGALPTEEIASKAIARAHRECSATQIAEQVRRATPPHIGRIHDDRFLLDLRAIFNPDDLVPHWSE